MIHPFLSDPLRGRERAQADSPGPLPSPKSPAGHLLRPVSPTPRRLSAAGASRVRDWGSITEWVFSLPTTERLPRPVLRLSRLGWSEPGLQASPQALAWVEPWGLWLLAWTKDIGQTGASEGSPPGVGRARLWLVSLAPVCSGRWGGGKPAASRGERLPSTGPPRSA